MNKQQAIDQVKQTFESSFEKKRFIGFIKNLLNGIEIAPFTYQGKYITNAFAPYVQRLERVGKYSDGERKIDILIVYLKKETSIERARTMQRNFIAWYLNGSRGGEMKDAALVAFVSPTSEDWRFSLVKMEYRLEASPSGKMKVKDEYTPARRWSFLVGKHEKSHTAQSRFVPLMANDEHDPTLANLEAAFSVEAVTKEFFLKYAELFGDIHTALEYLVTKDKTLCDEFKSKNINTVDFSKKLMGQIVFLYFLQKKGWLGVAQGEDWGSGPHDFLRRLAKGEYGKYINFFNEMLEPLFYDTLATDRGHEAWSDRLKCRLPFLNGGLFEALGNYDWQKIDVLLPNKLFTNQDYVEEGITGTGVLDVFDRYNFTVNEAEPLEKEVAIDPEMLGKVFENLIEENRRKGMGAFYTPREIVHYMCQGSLINYLDTVLNSENKIVERADIETFVHLGEQISHYEAVAADYKIKMPRSIEQNAQHLDEALAKITVCDPAVGSGAFPVGMMTEIVRARCALTPYFNDIQERTPYHFKRHAIQNCLYGVDIDRGAVEIAKLRLWLSLVIDEEDLKQIKPLPNLDYKIVPGNSLIGFPFKSQRLQEIERLKQQFFEETDHAEKARLKTKIDQEIQKSFAASKKSLGYEVNFDFEIYFSEVFHNRGGFDIVIANPPYDEISDKSQTVYFKAHYSEVLSGHYDLYIFFFRRAFDLGKKGTIISFITPHTYLQYSQFEHLRSWIYNHSYINEITSRIEGVFESVVVDNAIIVLSIGMASPNENTVFSEKTIDKGILLNLTSTVLPKSTFSDSSFDLNAIRNVSIIKRLSARTELLGDIVDSTQGITVYAKVQGEKIDYFQDCKIDNTCKPITRGREITKYHLDWSGRFIRYGNWLWCRRNPRFFESPKIFLRQTSDTLIGTYVEQPMYCIDSVHSLITRLEKADYDLKFILGILNSKLGAYIYELLICETGKVFAQVKLTFLRRFPIKIVAPQDQLSIIHLVEQILMVKAGDPEAITAALEHEIDRLVYELYELTEEEIAIMEDAK